MCVSSSFGSVFYGMDVSQWILGCLQFWNVMNEDAMNIHVQFFHGSTYVVTSLGEVVRTGVAES